MSWQQRKIFFVLGKGGVGKSTVSLALAQKLSKKEFYSLCVELGNLSYFQSLFGLDMKAMKSYILRENFELSRWTGIGCLTEYVASLVRSKSLSKAFFDNPLMSRLLEIAPGLFELSLLGKLTSGERGIGPEFNYDKIVLDSYATGHALSMIRAPKVMANSIKVGPIAEESKSIIDVLSDPIITQFILVSSPEEMAVAESEELFEDLYKELGQKPKIIVNRMIHAPEFSEVPSEVEDYFGQKIQSQESAMKRLKELDNNLLTSQLVLNKDSKDIDFYSEISKDWK